MPGGLKSSGRPKKRKACAVKVVVHDPVMSDS
jgi:hypothetical protein